MKIRMIIYDDEGKNIKKILEEPITFRKDGSSKSLADLFNRSILLTPPGGIIGLDFSHPNDEWNSCIK